MVSVSKIEREICYIIKYKWYQNFNDKGTFLKIKIRIEICDLLNV